MHWLWISIGACIVLTGCTKDQGADPSRRPDASYNPQFSPVDFRNDILWTNRYVHFNSDKIYVYEGRTEDGEEHIEVRKQLQSLNVAGIVCGILSEQTWINSQLVEVVEEYLAEDAEGNLWLMGLSVDNFSDEGVFINHYGSWKAGVEGAKPGIVMLNDPQPGEKYRQEYFFNIAEDQAEVIETGITVSTKMATFEDCIVIREWSDLEPGILDYKIYALGIGLVKEVNLSTGDIIELVDIR
jgi:hypothetical protein